MTRRATENGAPARRPWVAIVMIAVTAAASVAALVFRTQLRSHYWAWQILRSEDPAVRAIYLTALCNAGEDGWWGTSLLLGDARPEMRQLGVVVLQHVRTSRARTELLQALVDRDESVRELAALGLALQGDSRVVPTLKGLYRTADEGGAAAACVALERLGTPEAITALAELAPGHADADRRAALVDALGGIGQPECVPPLIELLSDERVCSGLPRALRAARGVLGDLAATGRLAIDAGSLPTQAAAQTVAERAAAALTRITGLNSPFASSAPAAERERAAQTWREWYRQRRGRP